MRRRWIRWTRTQFPATGPVCELTEIVSFGARGQASILARRNGRNFSGRELVENAGKLRRWLIFVANFAAQLTYIV